MCVPVIQDVDIPFASIYVVYNSSSSVYVTVSCFDPNGVSGTIEIMDPDLNPVGSISVSLGQGESQTYTVPLPQGYQEDYVVVTGTLNSYDIGTYAVHRQAEEILSPSSIPDARVAFLVELAVVAPLLGVALRGKPKEAGLGMFGLGVLYIPVMHAMGLQSPIPEFLGAFAALLGLIMVALNPSG